jgi:hypothetical protein
MYLSIADPEANGGSQINCTDPRQVGITIGERHLLGTALLVTGTLPVLSGISKSSNENSYSDNRILHKIGKE